MIEAACVKMGHVQILCIYFFVFIICSRYVDKHFFMTWTGESSKRVQGRMLKSGR